MARLLAGRQLVIQRSDIDHLIAHLYAWRPRNRNQEYSDIRFLKELSYCEQINSKLFLDFSVAYTLTRAFPGGCERWRSIVNQVLCSHDCIHHVGQAGNSVGADQVTSTINLLSWFVDQVRNLGYRRHLVAASKFAMFLWPHLPIFMNDCVIQNAISHIADDYNAGGLDNHNYESIWQRCALLYHPVNNPPFIRRAQVPAVPNVDHLTDDWLSRRLLDLALYRAVIVSDPVPAPPEDAPRIVFCQCVPFEPAANP